MPIGRTHRPGSSSVLAAGSGGPLFVLAHACVLVVLAQPALAHDAYETTLRRLGARLATHPRDVETRLRRAELLHRIGSFAGAFRDLAELRGQTPSDPRPLGGLVRLLADTRHHALAQGAAQSYLAGGGNDARVHWRLAKLHAHAGRIAAAKRSYEAAAAARPNPDIFLEWATLLENNGASVEGADVYRHGLRVLGDSVVLRLALVRALLASGDFAGALPHIERVLASSRLRGRWLVLRARALIGLARFGQARADLTAALLESERTAGRRSPVTSLSTKADASRLLATLPKGFR